MVSATLRPFPQREAKHTSLETIYKLQHWRAFPTIFGLQAAYLLEFHAALPFQNSWCQTLFELPINEKHRGHMGCA